MTRLWFSLTMVLSLEASGQVGQRISKPDPYGGGMRRVRASIPGTFSKDSLDCLYLVPRTPLYFDTQPEAEKVYRLQVSTGCEGVAERVARALGVKEVDGLEVTAHVVLAQMGGLTYIELGESFEESSGKEAPTDTASSQSGHGEPSGGTSTASSETPASTSSASALSPTHVSLAVVLAILITGWLLERRQKRRQAELLAFEKRKKRLEARRASVTAHATSTVESPQVEHSANSAETPEMGTHSPQTAEVTESGSRKEPATSSTVPAEIPCPICGETILSVAKKCKHCGEWLSATATRPDAPKSLLVDGGSTRPSSELNRCASCGRGFTGLATDTLCAECASKRSTSQELNTPRPEDIAAAERFRNTVLLVALILVVGYVMYEWGPFSDRAQCTRALKAQMGSQGYSALDVDMCVSGLKEARKWR